MSLPMVFSNLSQLNEIREKTDVPMGRLWLVTPVFISQIEAQQFSIPAHLTQSSISSLAVANVIASEAK